MPDEREATPTQAMSGPSLRIWRTVGFFLVVVLVSLYLVSGLFIVHINEHAIVERFGRPLNPDQPLGPGLHYAWAWPVSKVRRVDTGRIHSVALGYQGEPPKEAILWTNIPYEDEMLLLTQQNTLVGLYLRVHYKVDETADGPARFLYHCADPNGLLRAIAAARLRDVVSESDFFSMMTDARHEFEAKLQQSVQARAAEFGIQVVAVTVRDMHPPTAMAAAFEDVFSAEEDQEAFRSEAWGYHNDAIPRAKGQQAMMGAEADSYKAEKVGRAEGRAKAFEMRWQAYRQAPEVTRTRLYFDHIGQAMRNVKKYLVPAGRGQQPFDLWLLQGDKSVPLSPDQGVE